MSDKVLNGKGSFEIQGIPVGNNRVVVVDAYANSDERMNGITITAVTDIVPGDNVLDEINWETSKLGNVYKALIEAKTENLQSAKRIEELYTNAINAMKNYSGQNNSSEEDDEYEDYDD